MPPFVIGDEVDAASFLFDMFVSVQVNKWLFMCPGELLQRMYVYYTVHDLPKIRCLLIDEGVEDCLLGSTCDLGRI